MRPANTISEQRIKAYMRERLLHRTVTKICLVLFWVTAGPLSHAVTTYLPVHLSPEIEAQVEKLFVLANMPIIKRPIPVNQIHEALAKLEATEPALTRNIRRYLERYDKRAAFTLVSVEASFDNKSHYPLTNRRGIEASTSYLLSIRSQFIVNEHLAMQLGAISGDRVDGDHETNYDGSFVSFGHDYLQFDLGYRSHWLGPFQDSDMLISTSAPAMPGLTVSNSRPLPFLGFRYEFFWSRMSESHEIANMNDGARNSGHPKAFGIHFSIEPIEGFALGVNRLMQYGGANRDESLSGVIEAFFLPKQADNVGTEGRDFGNQLSSVTTRYTFPGTKPFSVYMEYAGEDTSAASDIHLGNSALMFGLHIPKLTDSLDLTIESGEWQNSWYTNSNFGDGLTNNGVVLGHWGANDPAPANGLHAEAQTAKLTWHTTSDQSVTAHYRRLKINSANALPYEVSEQLKIDYARTWKRVLAGITLEGGNDAQGDDFRRVALFVRW